MENTISEIPLTGRFKTNGFFHREFGEGGGGVLRGLHEGGGVQMDFHEGYALPQPDFSGLMSNLQIPQLQNMIDEEELCSTQPIFYLKEDVSVDTLKIFEANVVTQIEVEIAEGREIFQIEPKIVIALDEEENDMKIDVILDRPEKP
ncbi:hypothetical protein Syun_003714 [Stephania yunnanensis]|uniref:Uncharacterized protein n=1 Tax=Stephania yunnanensis TaxID=152371 RepID=A0AAP0L394_9MAGN